MPKRNSLLSSLTKEKMEKKCTLLFSKKGKTGMHFFHLFSLINITKTVTEKAGRIFSNEKLMAITFYKDRWKKTRDKKRKDQCKIPRMPKVIVLLN